MKKLLTIILPVVLLVIGVFVKADNVSPKAKTFIIGAGTQDMPGSKALLLRLSVQDAKPKSGVCPYYVRSLHYLETLQVLDVEVFKEICLNDSYGYSQGDVLWVVPSHLRNNGQQVKVLINNTKAGALVFEESRNSFSVSGD